MIELKMDDSTLSSFCIALFIVLPLLVVIDHFSIIDLGFRLMVYTTIVSTGIYIVWSFVVGSKSKETQNV